MRMVVAIVRPEKAQDVKDSVHGAGFRGMTITHVTGHGRQAGLRFVNRVGEFIVDEIEKTKFEFVVEDGQVDDLIRCICEAAHTGNAGDGRIFVLPVESTCRISDYRKAEEESPGIVQSNPGNGPEESLTASQEESEG